jgi:hypothetical protein
VRRKGAISHVAVFTGFTGIVARYVNSLVIPLYVETLGAKLST